MTNGVTQGVSQDFLRYHTDLNVRIRDLKVLPGAVKNPPDFMTFLNHPAPRTQEHLWTHSTILWYEGGQVLDRCSQRKS